MLIYLIVGLKVMPSVATDDVANYNKSKV